MRRFRFFFVLLLIALLSHCSEEGKQPKMTPLSQDEEYLVHAYTRVLEARSLASINALRAESLFARLDSTIDTLRIANTIRELDRDPDRWIIVFENIETILKQSSQGHKLEETR
jgi:hypothetical protein